MVGRVESTGNSGSPYKSGAAVQDTMRVAYDAKTQKFGPMKTSNTQNIDRMSGISSQVKAIKVPTDFSSPTFLARVATENKASGTQIPSNTRGVNVQAPQTIFSSVRSALDAI